MDNLKENSGSPENMQTTDNQETIFKELADISKYKRNVKNARYWLYMIAGYWLVYGVVYYSRMADQRTAIFIIGAYAVTGLVFLALALWSRKKASLPFLISLLFYVALSLWLMYVRPFNVQENIVRLLIVIILIKGYRDAKKYEEITKTFGDQPYQQET